MAKGKKGGSGSVPAGKSMPKGKGGKGGGKGKC
jgi:hypothetical protein